MREKDKREERKKQSEKREERRVLVDSKEKWLVVSPRKHTPGLLNGWDNSFRGRKRGRPLQVSSFLVTSFLEK